MPDKAQGNSESSFMLTPSTLWGQTYDPREKVGF